MVVTKDIDTDVTHSTENVKQPRTTRPKFSYEDILCSLNLKVSKDGVLHHMSIKPAEGSEPQPVQHYLNQDSYQSSQESSSQDKSSYIYNKYFNQTNVPKVVMPRVPKTKEEYRQMLLDDINTKRQSKLKRRMLYTTDINTNNTNISISKTVDNRLFRIKL